MEYGLIGEKLGHSFSKIIHNELFSYNYELKEIKPEEFDEFMRKADFKAINVTIPYKEMVMEYLDEISEKAKEIGAVNVVVNDDGKLIGYNTDFLGLKGLIQKNNIDLKDKKVLILGSGGTSKTALAVCRDLGAQQAFRVSRSGGNGLITYDEAEKVNADIIINTTPCGMFPNIEGAAFNIDKFDGLSAVVDVVYNPLNTDLIVKAKAKGIKAVGGLYMLVAQAIFAAEKFGFKVKEEDFERVYNKIFKEKQNLVLIGMPTSGKTTIGKILSEELGREFIDSDEEIVEKIGMSISEFFEKNGEAEFRKIEAQVIKEIALKQGAVIATGGGVILNKRNIELLKMNGKVIFLNRPLDMLLTSEDRPLSSDRELLKKRFEERHEIYKASADVEIIADSDIKTNVQKVKEGF